MAATVREDPNTRLIGGGHPLELVIDGRLPESGDREAVRRFIESACIHRDPYTCNDPLIVALHSFVMQEVTKP